MRDLRQEEKRKIVNLIIQGEAKNTKHILRMPEVRDGLKRILGDDEGEELFRSLDNLASSADRLDWLEPTERRGAMMQNGNMFGGAVDVVWK
jgi:hypothetical protein